VSAWGGIDEFTELDLDRRQRIYLRARRDGVCVRCFKNKCDSDRTWCKSCRGMRRDYPAQKDSICFLLTKYLVGNKKKLKLKFYKPRKKNQHHLYKYKGGWKSLKEIARIENVNYPMLKYWKRKGYGIKKCIKHLKENEKTKADRRTLA
jgi:hypothetical protein